MIHQKIADAGRRYQALEKAVSHIEMNLAKCQKEIDSLTSQHAYLEKQLDSLKVASEPKKGELDTLEKLAKIITKEEKEISRLTQGSKNLKEKALELQNKIENAGGEMKGKGYKKELDDLHNDLSKQMEQ